NEAVTFVAHNSYLQIWAEAGSLAFIVYVVMLLSVFGACRRIRRAVRGRDDLTWARVYANLFESVMVGFMIGSFFLNRGHFDLIYHEVAVVSCLYWITAKAVTHRISEVSKAKGTQLVPVVWRSGQVAVAGLPRWGRTK